MALRQLALALDAGGVSYQILGQLAWFVRDRMSGTDPGRVRPAIEALFRRCVPPLTRWARGRLPAWARDVADMVSGFSRSMSLHFLPEDRDAVDRALVTGRTLVESAPDSPLVRALAELADAVVPSFGVRPERGSRSSWVTRRTTG